MSYKSPDGRLRWVDDPDPVDLEPCPQCEALASYVPQPGRGPRLGDQHLCVCGTLYVWTGQWVKATEGHAIVRGLEEL